MRRATMTIAAVLAVLALGAAACAGDDESSESATEPGTDDGAVAPGDAPEPGVWSTFGYDLANSRFNPDEVVLHADNVAELEPLWELAGEVGVTSTPAVVDGVVYYGDFGGTVHAVDALDGSNLWSTELEGGQIQSSAAVHGDQVAFATNRYLYLLEGDTGEIIWSTQTNDHMIAITPVAPVIVDDLVLIGVASGELMIAPEDSFTFRGHLDAYDLATGDQVWRTYFTAGDDDEGAGVGIWSTPSVDVERGVVYVGTGNTYEPPQAPLSNSVAALSLETGEVLWSTQFTNPDVWSTAHPGGLDADVGAGPNLWSVGDQDLVGAGDKQGDYYAMDRDTGEIVWETKVSEGGLLGGVIGTSATDGETIYVASNENMTGVAAVAALDGATGEILWSEEVPGAVFAPVSVIPGVVFVSTVAASYHALDASDGSELWSMEIPDQGGSGASIVDGVVYWGYGFALFGSGSGIGGIYALAPGGAVSADGDDAGAAEADTAAAETYRARCASCHGVRGQGGVGPELVGVDDRLTLEEQLAIVRGGSGGQMPRFEGTLSDDEITSVVDYTRTDLGS